MDDFPYLIALALIEQEGKRAMPIGGKSLKTFIDIDDATDKVVTKVALELLLRVIQRSGNNSIKRVAGDKSILIAQIPMEVMRVKLPLIKKNWIESGDNDLFVSEMNNISNGLWQVVFVRYEGIKLIKCS
tara:strand:+ start:393 stop:782 length:390 start_codon:yes stop_codon:yes gene_type:complete